MTPQTRERLELEAKSAIAWLFFDRRYTNVDEGVFYSPENLSPGQIERADMVFNALAPIIDELVQAEREADGWQDIATAPDLDRVMVAGWQPACGTTRGYWWWHEDGISEGRAIEHPAATHWLPIKLPAFPAPPAERGA